MRGEPGSAELAAARRDWTAYERLKLSAELSERAFDIVWAALREFEAKAGRLDELERARFILSRLYPEMRGPRLDGVLDDLAARRAAGSWTGFVPPASFVAAGGLP
jgi:hypothetical protein